MIRRAIPLSLLPLTVLVSGLAGAPWLRAFPAEVMAAPLFGAAVLSTLVPVVIVALVSRRLWLSALFDLVAGTAYLLIVVLHSPAGFGDLVDGLVHGPSQVLTFALPLVSPRTLLVAPVALCWLVGAVAGECLARGWSTVLPYAGWLVAFGLAYAGTERAAVADARHARGVDVLLAAALLAALLLLRTAQSWVRQDATAEATEAAGILPLRGLAGGVAVAAGVAVLAAGVVQAPTFARRPATPQRVPSVDQSRPLTPLSFIAGLRPDDPADPGVPVFTVSTDQGSPAYLGIATVDYYDGDGWGFHRTFRPSGGVVPAEADPALRVAGSSAVQRYTIGTGPLAGQPWMPSAYRAQKVTGTAVNVDAGSGMLVPARPMRPGDTYTVRSAAAAARWDDLPATSLPATSPPPDDTLVPASLRATLGTVVTAFAEETDTRAAPAVPFLQAVARTLRSNYHLAGPQTGLAPSPSQAPSPSPPRSARPGRHPSRSVVPTAVPSTPGSPPPQRAGSTGFADVLASVVGPFRAATPEQYATLFALLARQVGVPARVATGFRLTGGSGGSGGSGASTVDAGTHEVRTGQAWSWVEIPIRGQGWVVVDPSPSTYSGAAQQPTVGASQSTSPTAPPTQDALITTAAGGHAVAPKSTVSHEAQRSRGPWFVAVLGGLGLFAVLVLVVLLLRKTRRSRRRRRAPDPRTRLLGAWQESLDVLVESGLPELRHLTSTEVVGETAARFGPEPARHAALVGQAANLAMYSPSTPVDPADADRAWNSHRELRRQVRRRLGMRARIVARLSYHRTRVRPRSTGRYRARVRRG